MIPIKYLKEEVIQAIKSNLNYVLEIMKSCSDNSWLDLLGFDECFGETKILVNEFKMNTSFSNPRESDLANSIIIFEALKDLNETQATDERLWAGLAFTICYDYMLYRWPLDSETKVKYRFVYEQNIRRAIMYQGISRLWWIARYTYDDKLNNPYELTEYAFSHPQIMKSITYRNYSNSSIVRKAILNALKNFEISGGKVKTELIDELNIKISLLGSVSIIDSYEYEELYDKLYSYIIEIYKKMGECH